MDYQEILAGTVGKEKTYGTLVGRVKASAMSFARFSTDDVSGKMRGYVGGGAFTNDPLETFGGIGVVAIADLQRLLRYICENGFEHHVAANLSNSAARGARGDVALPRLEHALARRPGLGRGVAQDNFPPVRVSSCAGGRSVAISRRRLFVLSLRVDSGLSRLRLGLASGSGLPAAKLEPIPTLLCVEDMFLRTPCASNTNVTALEDVS